MLQFNWDRDDNLVLIHRDGPRKRIIARFVSTGWELVDCPPQHEEIVKEFCERAVRLYRILS